MFVYCFCFNPGTVQNVLRGYLGLLDYYLENYPVMLCVLCALLVGLHVWDGDWVSNLISSHCCVSLPPLTTISWKEFHDKGRPNNQKQRCESVTPALAKKLAQSRSFVLPKLNGKARQGRLKFSLWYIRKSLNWQKQNKKCYLEIQMKKKEWKYAQTFKTVTIIEMIHHI